jgi:hypothetical protein
LIPIYQAHPGPYSLMLTRRIGDKKVASEVKGPYLAHAAHATACSLISDPTSNIIDVHVYSEKEHQFIGAMYFRGQEYTAWSEEEIHALAGATRSERTERAEARRGQRGAEPVREDDASVEGSDGDRPGAQGDPVRAVRSKKARDRFPTVRGKGLALGNAEGWPPSKPAQIVREFFAEGRTATVAEVVQALGPALAEVGMQFPAALVSRLKQKGLLKETTTV